MRNRGFAYSERIESRDDGQPVGEYLARRYPHSSEAVWLERIESGQVLLDGRRATPTARLRAGQRLEWHRPPWTEPAAPRCFAVLHRDALVLAVAKPAGLPTLPGAGFLESTLLRLVAAYDPAAAPVHRLGRWTSGLVLFARTSSAAAHLGRQWAERGVSKRYRALASGSPHSDGFEVCSPIGPVSHRRLGTMHAATPDGKPARSRVSVLERREGAFLCDVEISTGRPHQIQIHLAHAGFPLVGDPLYTREGPNPGSLPGDGGYRLHAAELRLRHPGSGQPLRLECAPPPDLRMGHDPG